MTEIYRPFFVEMYRSMGSSLPIGVWAEVIGRNLPMFASDSQVYNPASVRVRMTRRVADPEGVAQLDVSLADADWYDKLVATIGAMMGRSGAAVDLVTDAGKPVAGMTYSELNNAGDLDVVDRRTRAPVHTSRVTAPPRHMAPDKHVDILDWFKGVRDQLVDIVVREIKGKDMSGLEQAVAEKGPVKSAVQSFVTGSVDNWGAFLQTYAENDAVRALDPQKVAAQIARSILTEVRKSLRANQKQIKTFFAYQRGDGEQLWDSKITSNITKPDYRSDLEMYEEITDDALHKAMLERKIYHIIHAGANLLGRQAQSQVARRRPRPSAQQQQHPMDWYHHKHHYNRFGKVPGHVMRSFNQQFDKGARRQRPAYTGDSVRALSMFHLFSGRHMLPTEAKAEPVRKARLIPTDSELGEMPRLVPISSEMPRLTPINSEMPRLVPISSEMPRLVPISSEMPRLVPIQGLADDSMFVDELELAHDANVFVDDLPI